jgi:transcriptional regulator with PAS, ATPase and Fis domain
MHSSGIRYEDAVREFKRTFLREVLIANRGNQCKAAEELGIETWVLWNPRSVYQRDSLRPYRNSSTAVPGGAQ